MGKHKLQILLHKRFIHSGHTIIILHVCIYSIYMYIYIYTYRSRVRFPMVSLEFFSDNPSGRTLALGSTKPLTEMSTRCIYWG
jgi:hypothetical protein